MIWAPAEARLHGAEVNAAAGSGIAHIGAMVDIPIELPQVIDGVHVVIHDVEEHGEAALVAGVDQRAQIVGRAMARSNCWGCMLPPSAPSYSPLGRNCTA